MNDDIESLSEAEAKSMLRFFFSQLQRQKLPTYVPPFMNVNGGSSYQFSNGWPMQYCVGKSAMDAVRRAMAIVRLSIPREST